MSRRADFYSISFCDCDGIIAYSINDFFNCLSEVVFPVEETGAQIVRRIGEKFIRIFPFYYSHNRRQFVVPFGKLKDKNKPYWINEENRLEEIPASLYDINSLGFDVDYDVMIFTTNREGPSVQNVEEHLNTFIPQHTGLSIKIEPIMYNTGIEKIRNARLVKSITLNLDLGQPLNEFYLNEININQDRPINRAFRAIAESARNEGNSKVLSLTFGLGKHGKKEDTLDLDSMLYLLEHINIGAEFVKEIKVNYKNGSSDKMDVAKLKDTNMLLFYPCKCDETQVSPENLLNNINDAVADKVIAITRYNREHYENVRIYNGNAIDIVEEWDNNIDCFN